jgi:V/A-type H+/Na+-transporting ATPase subunit E
MPEHLDSLIEKIRKDGVETARAEAEAIVAEAGRKADALLKQASAEAETARAKAEKDSAAYAERAEASIRQAARDVILSVGAAIEKLAAAVAARAVQHALDPDTLRRLVAQVVEAYCRDTSGAELTVLLNPEQKDAVQAYLMQTLAAELRSGVTLRDDAGVVAGFRVSIADKQVEHDFSSAAIAAALAELLRPELGAIVRSAAEP